MVKATSQGPDAEGTLKPLALHDLQRLFTEMRHELTRMLRRRTGDPELAADLAQDVFVKLTSVRAAIPNHDHGRAYLFRMASNLAIDYGRIERRRGEILSGADVLFEDAQASPHEAAIGRDQLRQIEAALAELPSRCREVLFLSQVQGMSHREIADRLDVSISMIEKYRLRALRHCRQRLTDEI